jgi:peptidoglycan/LPS O-acetylase OafA/YrhL
VAAFLALRHQATTRLIARWPVGVVAGLLFIATLLGSRAQLWFGNDFLIGAAFAAMVPWLARAGAESALYRRVGFMMSECSYTLYLVHFPLLAWIYFTFTAPAQLPFDARSVVIMACVLGVVMLYAGAIWWLFERNTDRVRAFVSQRLPRQGWRPHRV